MVGNLIFEALANLKYKDEALASRSLNRSLRSDSQIWLASRNFYGSKGRSSLMYVSARGDLKRMRFLINETNADINACCNLGYSALCWAILSQQLESIKLLLHHGANVYVTSKKHESPLILAITVGDLKIVKTLINHGCLTLGAWNSAIRLGRIDIIDYFSTIKLDPDTFNIGVTKYYKKMTTLMWATKRSNIFLMKHLMDAKTTVSDDVVGVNAQIESGETALFFAIREKCYESSALLIKNGALDLCRTNGFSPLMLATNMNQNNIVKLLVEEVNFLIDHEDESGHNALFYAILNENVELVKYFCAFGCNLNNALQTVAHESFWETAVMAQIVLNHGAIITSDAVDAAFVSNNVRFIEFILDQDDLDIDMPLNNDCTILSKACFLGHLNTVNRILETRKVSVFTNALVFAATEGHLEIVKVLLARYQLPKSELRNAFQASIGHSEILDILCSFTNYNKPFKHGPFKNYTALMAVCKIGIPKSLRVLLSHGAREVPEIYPFYVPDLGMVKSCLELCDRSIEGLECLELLFDSGSFRIPKYDN